LPPTAKCVIQLREVVPFEWDRMFYFDYGVSPAARRTAVGSPFDTEELRRQLIFLRNGQVVRNDLLPTDVEKPIENELAFEAGDQADWLSCDRGAQFEVIRDSFGTVLCSSGSRPFPAIAVNDCQRGLTMATISASSDE
jgi:hypothetical protein